MSSALRPALALALGAAVSLGLARFAYALLLPPMRADLGWSYTTAGTLHTLNALGYLLGALLTPALLRRWPARSICLAGMGAAALLLAAHALTRESLPLAGLRVALGAASALSFVSGGLLAARLAQQPGVARPTLILGLFYGGVGLGITAAALGLPPLLRTASHWPMGWWALAGLALLATLGLAAGTRTLAAPPQPATATADQAPLRFFLPALAAYTCFGLGYIGTLTFNLTLLRERGLDPLWVDAYFVLLGLAAMSSPWLWAGVLARWRDGKPMALLNALLALATLVPVFSPAPAWVLAAGALFGAVFLSVVASTTALVRHNLPPSAWAGGIAAFTSVFAAGQVLGPGLVGWVADRVGGLEAGLALSAGVLACGALLALLQRAR